MFTGIVEEIGIARDTNPKHLTFEAGKVLEGTKAGDSIAVNGVCLTVTSLSNHSFSVDVMPETLRHSNLGRLHYGDRVNLERAAMAGGRLGGHLVLGHIDDTGKIITVTSEETARIIRISAPAKLMPYIVSKGFIAVDGVSLTIVDLDSFSFTVSLVAYTLEHTTLGDRRPGDMVNLEVDIIAKYVEGLLPVIAVSHSPEFFASRHSERVSQRPERSEGEESHGVQDKHREGEAKQSGLTFDFLKECGFVEGNSRC